MRHTRKYKSTQGRTRRTKKPATISNRKKQIIIGKIFADWCGHCTALQPEWNAMKRQVKLQMGRTLGNADILFIDIGDTEKNRLLGNTVASQVDTFNAKHLSTVDPSKQVMADGYPTIFKLCNGRVEYFKGTRTRNELYAWATQDCNATIETSGTTNKARP